MGPKTLFKLLPLVRQYGGAPGRAASLVTVLEVHILSSSEVGPSNQHSSTPSSLRSTAVQRCLEKALKKRLMLFHPSVLLHISLNNRAMS